MFVKMRLVLGLLLCVLVVMWPLSFFQLGISYGLSDGGVQVSQASGRAIDLYTQKEPYSGRGLNQPSDAFAPQEEVILYAYVTYNDDPVQGKIVSFEVRGPINLVENVSFTRSAVTDAGGVATVSFRIPWPAESPEEVVFGVWTVVALVDIAEVAVEDTLTFKVGWIVEILRVETVDVNNSSKTSFVKGEHMHFRLTVKNIAMTDKVATLTLDVYDELEFLLGVVTRENVKIPPGVTVYFIEDLLIPTSAFVGVGVVSANAYSVLGAPWCPQVATTFLITRLIVHDVAVISVVPSTTEVFTCHVVNVTVVVKNEGNVTETFDVSAYYDSVLIGTAPVISLPPGVERTLTFGWSTSCVPEGVYTLSAVANTVPGETDVEDNSFVDGTVRVKYPSVPPVVSELPAWLMWLLIILIILVAASLFTSIALLFYVRKKKENSPVKVADPVTYEEKTHKTCIKCGKEFLAVYTFCPHCFTYNG